MKKRPGAKGLLFAGLAGIAVLLTVVYIFIQPFSPRQALTGEQAQEYFFRVEKGDSAALISEKLASQGIVKNAWVFKAVLKFTKADRRLQAGTYRFSGGANYFQVARTLSSGDVVLVSVVIAEGLTVRMIAEHLEAAGICDSEEMLRIASDQEFAKSLGLLSVSLEGYLFPDTYRFAYDSDPRTVLKTMVERFFEKASALSPSLAGNAEALRKAVILASIIEREYRIDEEAPLMASVFSNRLKIGMPLQSCATVVYILTEKLGKPHPDTVYYKDLQLKDPYNTYVHAGLPPGPISNPGEVALKAAFAPAESQYLYFRLIDATSGRHHFSTSFDEHLQAAIPVKGW